MTGSGLRLYVSGYTSSSGGHGPGITVLDRATPDAPWHATQIVEVDDPSFIVVAEGALHAVSETVMGRVISYTVSAGALEASSVATSGGAAPCHIALDPASGALVVANYTAGSLSVVSADASDPARVAKTLALPVGRGPVAERQEQPHAHQITPTPWGTVLVSDLGADRLHEVRVDPITLEPSFVSVHEMPAGSGPRHLAWFGENLLVAGELDGLVHVLSRHDEAFSIDYSVVAHDLALPESAVGFAEAVDTGGTSPLLSHIAVADERVYIAVRGRDTITVLAPGGDAAHPERLGVVAEVPCGGRWPRHFAVTPGALYVANQLSDTVAILPLDPDTGIPGAPTVLIETGSPACVVFG